MLACLRSAAVFGVEAHTVHVEVDVSFGLPQFTMVGLPDTSVRESRDRVRAAIRNSDFEFPGHRITVNLAPADVRKAGASFDLPIALGVLAASGAIARRTVDDLVLVGELSLDGSIQPTRGVLPVAVAARREGLTGLLLPTANAAEAVVVGALRLYPVQSLREAVEALNHPDRLPSLSRLGATAPVSPSPELDFADVRGQSLAKRALEVAAAGGHNVLLVGPPGAGKTMLARRVPGLLPALSFDEALEATAIHSVAGTLPPGVGLLAARPFRAPHHTISDVALVGGGTVPRPGEISLAHHGVLFLDEMPEFDRRVLEVLRQPLEEGQITIARAARTAAFPCRFMLIGAMNPCPCGCLGDAARTCRCTPPAIERYRARLSGPLRERIDLFADVPAVPLEVLMRPGGGEATVAIRARVMAARERQAVRLGSEGCRGNADLQGRAIWRHCRPDDAGVRLLDAAFTRLGLSARTCARILKVSRTIADLQGADEVAADHVAEALQYRTGD